MSSDVKKSKDILVTQENLNETRAELKSDIATLRLEMKAGFADVKSEINGVKSEIKALTAAVHRTLAIVEEQNSKNNYVLDGYASLRAEQEKDRAEGKERFENIESVVFKLRKDQ